MCALPFAAASYIRAEPCPARRTTPHAPLHLPPQPKAFNASFNVGRTHNSSLDAVAGTDFRVLSNVVSFAAGATNGSVRLELLGDAVKEGDRYLGLTLANGTGYAIGYNGRADLAILDDDGPQVGWGS